MDKSTIHDIETRLDESGRRFELDVKEAAVRLNAPEHVARTIVRTANGIESLARDVMRLSGASSERDMQESVENVTKNDDGTYVDLVAMLENFAFSKVALLSAYKAFKRAADMTRDGKTVASLSIVVDMSSLLLAAIESLAEEAKSRSGAHAANASHARHHDNERAAREWYAKHKKLNKKLTRDDAATRIRDEGIVNASWRTIRKYLINQ